MEQRDLKAIDYDFSKSGYDFSKWIDEGFDWNNMIYTDTSLTTNLTSYSCSQFNSFWNYLKKI